MARILIGALSCLKYQFRRARCMETWVPQTRRLDLDFVFLVGQPDLEKGTPERHGDLLLLPCPSDYPSLPQRTLWFCRWALAQPWWDYLLKCDDDTYLAAQRLAKYNLADRDYIGAEWQPGVGYGSGGAGYLLSRKAAAIVAEKLTQPTGPEDLLAGKVLREAGVDLSIEPRFTPFSGPDRYPRRDNDRITGHHLESQLWAIAHDEMSQEANG